MIPSASSIYQSAFNILQTDLSNKDPQITIVIKNLLKLNEELEKERDSLKKRVKEVDASIPEIINCMNVMKNEILENKIECKNEILESKNEIKILRKENQELKKKSDATAKQLKEEEVIINAYRMHLQKNAKKQEKNSKIWSWI